MSILSSPRRVGRGERDRDREGLSRLFDSFPFLKGGRSWLGLLLRDLEYEGLPRRHRGLMLRFLPAGVPLRRLAYLRGGDLEGLRDSDFIRRRLAGGGLRLPLSLKRRSPRSRGGVAEGDLGRRLLGGGERDVDADAGRRGGVGRRPREALRFGGDRDRELLSRETDGDRRRCCGGDRYLRGGERDPLGVMERDLRRGGGERDDRRRGPCKNYQFL